MKIKSKEGTTFTVDNLEDFKTGESLFTKRAMLEIFIVGLIVGLVIGVATSKAFASDSTTVIAYSSAEQLNERINSVLNIPAKDTVCDTTQYLIHGHHETKEGYRVNYFFDGMPEQDCGYPDTVIVSTLTGPCVSVITGNIINRYPLSYWVRDNLSGEWGVHYVCSRYETIINCRTPTNGSRQFVAWIPQAQGRGLLVWRVK